MKVFVAFLVACFVVGGIPATHSVTIKRPAILFALCFLVAASYLSLRVAL
jgi:hypothetical protein